MHYVDDTTWIDENVNDLQNENNQSNEKWGGNDVLFKCKRE